MKFYIVNRIVKVAGYVYKSLKYRNHCIDIAGSFTVAGPIIDFAGLSVAEPFLRPVKQFDGVAEIEEMVFSREEPAVGYLISCNPAMKSYR